MDGAALADGGLLLRALVFSADPYLRGGIKQVRAQLSHVLAQRQSAPPRAPHCKTNGLSAWWEMCCRVTPGRWRGSWPAKCSRRSHQPGQRAICSART